MTSSGSGTRGRTVLPSVRAGGPPRHWAGYKAVRGRRPPRRDRRRPPPLPRAKRREGEDKGEGGSAFDGSQAAIPWPQRSPDPPGARAESPLCRPSPYPLPLFAALGGEAVLPSALTSQFSSSGRRVPRHASHSASESNRDNAHTAAPRTKGESSPNSRSASPASAGSPEFPIA